jgi:hypothetical protein
LGIARCGARTMSIDQLEQEAMQSRHHEATRGALWLRYRGPGDFVYTWGNACVSRREASLRASATQGGTHVR